MTQELAEVKSLSEQIDSIKAGHKALMKATPLINSIWYEIKDIPQSELRLWAKEHGVEVSYCEPMKRLQIQVSAERSWKDYDATCFAYSRKGTVKSSSFSGFKEHK